MIHILLTTFIVLLTTVSSSRAADPPKEDDYYRIVTLPVPKDLMLEAGALELMPDGKLAVSSRRGDIYMIGGVFNDPPTELTTTKFAGGLHEILGLVQRDGWLYATQRGEVTRLKDVDGDGRADLFETFNDDWDISGDYHEYAFGSKFDRDGNLWVALCLTGSFSSQVKYRGWCVRITPDGKLLPTCSGLRSPGGIGMNAAGDMFYTDNQGPWNGSCCLKHLEPGSFQGHPDGNAWYKLPEVTKALGPQPQEPESGSRWHVEAAKIPQLYPTAVWFPYPKMGQSASGIDCDRSAGKFGPFANQVFVGDQSHSTVMRVYMEKVKGRYQGVCFPFRAGFSSGNLALQFAPDGSLLVNGTNRGWGSRGQQPFALERLVWTGKTPFEVLEMHALKDGFDLKFTKPVDAAKAADVSSYKLSAYTYIYHKTYGSPEVDTSTPTIEKAAVSADGKSVRLTIKGLQQGHVHEFHLDGLQSATGQPLLHKEAYYTLNNFPD